MTFEELAKKVAEIPHLDLGIQFDSNIMLEEVEAVGVEAFKPYNSLIPSINKMVSESWHGFSLLSSDGSIYNDLKEDNEFDSRVMSRTLVADHFPYTMRAINTLSDENCRARIMKINPGGRLSWHSHQFDFVKYNPDNIVVHVPILVPEKFRYCVISVRDFRLGDIENEGLKVYSQNYGAGRATLFNNVHMHNVFNDDEFPRISLMLNLKLSQPKTFEIVKNAVEKYDGPLLKMDI